MSDDPYCSAGVWASVDVMECRELAGAWIDGERVVADGAYAVLFDAVQPSAVRPRPGSPLLAASLHEGSRLGVGTSERWGAIAYVRADSIADARRVAGELESVRSGAWRAHVWAIPKALGSWSRA
jgi:hypothetical protein